MPHCFHFFSENNNSSNEHFSKLESLYTELGGDEQIDPKFYDAGGNFMEKSYVVVV